MDADKQTLIERKALENFCTKAFEKAGLSEEDAELSAKILVAADARGIPSHGDGRMMRYIKGIECRHRAGKLLEHAAQRETRLA